MGMKRVAACWAACLAAATAAATTASSSSSVASDTSPRLEPDRLTAAQNGFQIFNAIHSAMRQWGSSLNHNGLSVFLATVPSGTILHHGTWHPEPPTTPEWLAFEIEHAELFARSRMVPPSKNPPPDDAHPLVWQQWYRAQRQPPSSEADLKPDEDHGYLHLYKVTKPLRLLYLDGMSAGNTNMGTLDTQDFLLRGNRSTSIWNEYERAQSLCAIVTPWGLDGVIRMELGFEIIKCDFSKNMQLIKVNRRPDPGDRALEGYSGTMLIETVRAVSEGYHSIGGGKVVLDFSSMVSAMFYPVNLTNPDPEKSQPHLRRLASVTDEQLHAIKLRIETVVRDRVDGSKPIVDWQGVTDMIAARYADRLWNMAEKVDSLEVLQGIVNGLVNTHIDYSAEDGEYYWPKIHCTEHFVQFSQGLTLEDQLIATALRSVTRAICTTLFEVRKLIVDDPNANEESFAASKRLLKSLSDKLRWSRWKECTGCSFDEVCFLPMCPFGDRASYDRPNCRNMTTITNGWEEDHYWEPRSGRHGRPAKPGDGKNEKGPKDL